MINIARQYKSFDILLFLLVVAVAIFGIFAIESASLTASHVPSLAEKQKVFVITGVVLLLLAAFIDYQLICRFYILIYVFNLILLAIVLFQPTVAGVARWINIGSVSIQPSEFTKLFMIIFLAKFIDKEIEKINNIRVLFIIAAATIIPVWLIQRQPALSASLVLLFIVVTMVFIAGLSYKFIFAIMIVVLPLAILFFYDLTQETHIFIDTFLEDYQLKRLYAWLNPELYPDSSYQTNQSLRALASGQFSGKGLNQGVISQFASFLPHAESDFIFALVGEEFGFVGSVTLLGIVLLIVLKCLLIAQKAPDNLGKLLVSGVAAMIAFQTFDNICVATGLLPNTGMPFPFVSAGGSSLWVSMISIGLVLNVGMSKQKSIFEG